MSQSGSRHLGVAQVGSEGEAAAPSEVPVVDPEDDERAAEYGSDPVARALLFALAGVVILFMVAVVSAMAFGFLSPAKAPRTLMERDLATYGELVKNGRADAQNTAKYVAALIDSGQLSEARRVLAQALASATADKSYLQLQQARLEYASGDVPAAASIAEEARLTAESELAARLKALAAKSIKTKTETERPASWSQAVHLRADALAEMKDDALAIEAYDTYLKVEPGDADILVARGELKERTGDTEGAESDFRQALKFIPDLQSALDGLERIGASAK